MKKILIITPKFPLPASGACEKDRLKNITDFKRNGFEVRVIAKVFDFQDQGRIREWGSQAGVKIDLLPYEFTGKRSFLNRLLQIVNPLRWDGAASEYSSMKIRVVAEQIADEWRPDLVWFDYTYLWPLYYIFTRRKIPIITRSINFEAWHYLEEDGFSPWHILKALPKFASELITTLMSSVIFAITPKEAKIYRYFGGGRRISVLPLRGLSDCIGKDWQVRDSHPLHIFFMGASYNVHHNRRAAEFILKEIAPRVLVQSPGDFVFHILGKKLPVEFNKYLSNSVKYDGFVDLDKHLPMMDIAVVPSLSGGGMQQKIFEPLTLGIPSVVSERGIAGYPFRDGVHALLVSNRVEDFVAKIVRLKDFELRRKLSDNSRRLCAELFSNKALDLIVLPKLNKVVSN